MLLEHGGEENETCPVPDVRGFEIIGKLGSGW